MEKLMTEFKPESVSDEIFLEQLMQLFNELEAQQLMYSTHIKVSNLKRELMLRQVEDWRLGGGKSPDLRSPGA
jgi:hypothetical protein